MLIPQFKTFLLGTVALALSISVSSALAESGPRVGFTITKEQSGPAGLHRTSLENALLLKFSETVKVSLQNQLAIQVRVDRKSDDATVHFCLFDLEKSATQMGCNTIVVPIDGNGNMTFKSSDGTHYGVKLSVSVQSLPSTSTAELPGQK